jgi:hypothetical protein
MNAHRRMLLLGWLLLGAACSQVRVDDAVTLQRAGPPPVPEQELLDVDIQPFSALLDNLETAAADGPSLQGMRQAERHYLSRQLAESMRQSGGWGLVRLDPGRMPSAALQVSGVVLQSDGQTLRLQVEAVDAQGRTWLRKEYLQVVLPNAAQSLTATPPFRFEPLIRRIANDLLERRDGIASVELLELNQRATLNFAATLVPEAYAPYLQGDELDRLPAGNDPVWRQVEEMRSRNDAFLDAMQMRYDLHVDNIGESYLRFLDRSLTVTDQVNQNGLEFCERVNGNVVYKPKHVGRMSCKRDTSRSARPLNPRSTSNILNRGNRAGFYAEVLAAANQPLEEIVAPVTLQFGDRTVQLTGTVEEQFRQWQGILAEMYRLEVVAE